MARKNYNLGSTITNSNINSRVNINTSGAKSALRTAGNVAGNVADYAIRDYAANGPIVSAQTLGTAAGGAAGLAVSGAGAAVGVGVGAIGMVANAIQGIHYAKKLGELEKNKPGPFQNSQDAIDARNKWQSEMDNRPDPYESPYADKIAAQLEAIENRDKFNYDFTQDPTYWQYRDQYVREGKLAMQDTVADVSALTGGYGNSYAATAGSQAYQSYLNDLNNVIPSLREQAFNEYQAEGDNMYKQMNLLQSLDESEYRNWEGKVGEYYQFLDRLYQDAVYLDEKDWQQYLQQVNDYHITWNEYFDAIQDAKQGFMDSGSLAANTLMSYGSQVGDVGMTVGGMLGSDVDSYLGNKASNYVASGGIRTKTSSSAGTGTTTQKKQVVNKSASTKKTTSNSGSTDFYPVWNDGDNGGYMTLYDNNGNQLSNEKFMTEQQFKKSDYAGSMTYEQYMQKAADYSRKKK